MDIKFRSLRADEIEVRAGQVWKNGCTLLLYKNARVDMALLDEVCGVLNWKREHESINGSLFCTVSIYDNDKMEWISKQDVGVKSNFEPVKGEASDAFKRACTNLGIGQELYSAPHIKVDLTEKETKQSGNKLLLANGVKFKVADITVEENKIVKLVIVDQDNYVRFKMGGSISITEDQSIKLKYLRNQLGLDKSQLAVFADGINIDVYSLTEKTAEDLITALEGQIPM